MERQSMRGAEPLEQPDAATAQAYLDVLPGVRHRAEGVLDLRRLGRLYIVEGIALAAFLGVLQWTDLLHRLRGGLNSSWIYGLLVLMILWSSLSLGIRERYGARQGIHGATRVMNIALLGVATLGAVVLIFVGADAPGWLRAVPALVALIGGTLPGIALFRDARGTRRLDPPEHAVMTRAGRVATVACGVVLSVTGFALGWAVVGGPLVSTLALAFEVVALFIIAIRSRMGLVTELGAMWRPPQWSAFALSALIIGAATVQALAAPVHGLLIGVVAAGAILVLFVVAALWPAGRDA